MCVKFFFMALWHKFQNIVLVKRNVFLNNILYRLMAARWPIRIPPNPIR